MLVKTPRFMKDNKFTIVIPVYNSEKIVVECINSIKNQNYKNFKVIIINDGSTDNTEKDILDNIDNRFTYLKNDKRNKQLYSHVRALNSGLIREDEIVVHCDGDDKFINNNALSIINSVYISYPNILSTYGSWVSASGRQCVCKPWDKKVSIEEYIYPRGWIFSQVRTFKYFLWKHVNQKYSLYDNNNKLFTSAADVAIMKPILELSGRNRVAYIKNILYYYRDNRNLNVHNCNLNDQVRCALELHKKNPYNKLSYE